MSLLTPPTQSAPKGALFLWSAGANTPSVTAFGGATSLREGGFLGSLSEGAVGVAD